MLLNVSQSITQNVDTLAVIICEIATQEPRSNLAFIMTLSIFAPFAGQTTDFGKTLLSVSQSITQNLDSLAGVVWEISTHELG